MFTYEDAMIRLEGGYRSAFMAGTELCQKLQIINELLERFYNYGDWRGLHDQITLVPVGGVISLPLDYIRLDGLGEASSNQKFLIKSKAYPFQTNGVGVIDYTSVCAPVAIDQGDIAGVRKYLIAGNPTTNDTRTFTGLARRRYTWATDVKQVVYPDCFEALRRGIAAMNAESEGDNGRYNDLFQSALAMLDQNVNEFESETDIGPIQFEPMVSAGMVFNLL